MITQKTQHDLCQTALLAGLRQHLQPLADDARQYDRLLDLIGRARFALRQSHNFHTRLAQQFDAVIHIDETSAVEPLDVGQVWSDGEAPETFPSGI